MQTREIKLASDNKTLAKVKICHSFYAGRVENKTYVLSKDRKN